VTWTTLSPNGATQPVSMMLFAATALALAYAVGLLYRVAQLTRLTRIQAEAEEEEEP